MVTERLEVRLDAERRRKLKEIAEQRGAPVSEVVRQLIDQAYQDIDRAMRMRAAQALIALEIEDVPDPETLNRQSESTYGIPDLR